MENDYRLWLCNPKQVSEGIREKNGDIIYYTEDESACMNCGKVIKASKDEVTATWIAAPTIKIMFVFEFCRKGCLSKFNQKRKGLDDLTVFLNGFISIFNSQNERKKTFMYIHEAYELKSGGIIK